MEVADPVAVASSRPWWQIYLNRGAMPFWSIHVAALVGIVALGWSWTGLAIAVALYIPRMIVITGGYHRYFSHRSFKTSRWFQFVIAWLAESTAQRGVLWWASHHRKHHKISDQPGDLHAPQYGFLWSHVGWILVPDNATQDMDRVKDLHRFPELRWIDKHWLVPPIVLGVGTWLIGGWYALVWAFFVSQVLSWHGAFTINSLTHIFGKRRYATDDDSRNHWLLALITMGEGWHNNHHHYQVAARQGFRWWEIDVTYYVLRCLAAVGLVWDLHGVPDHIIYSQGECDSRLPTSSSGAPSSS